MFTSDADDLSFCNQIFFFIAKYKKNYMRNSKWKCIGFIINDLDVYEYTILVICKLSYKCTILNSK